jgi:hypothetical protein
MDVPHTRRLATLIATTAATFALTASAAHAATSLSLTIGNDPVESVATQIGVAGAVPDDQERVYVHQKPTGGTACGVNPDADDGDSVIDTYLLTTGDYNKSANITFTTAGTYLVCAWMKRASDSAILLTDSKVVTVRVPKLALAVAATPTTVSQGQTFQVTATAQAEAERSVSLFAIVDTGRGCPANAAAADQADAANPFWKRSIVGGPTTLSANLSLSTPGAYLLCGYFQYRSSSDPPQAVAAAAFTVLAPPPPCVVPALVARELPAAAKGRLAAASCTPGKLRYVASARYPRGTVFKFSPPPGTSLANAAVVSIYVSAGSPCIVPAIPSSRSLKQVKRRLTASGCTVGKVTHRRSRTVRRGRVVALSRARGKHLAPRTAIGIVVSRGRR